MKVNDVGHINEIGQVVIYIGVGSTRREIPLDIYQDPAKVSWFLQEQQRVPYDLSELFGSGKSRTQVHYAFRNQVFKVEYESAIEAEEEAILRIKKTVYLQDHRLKKLRTEVEALEGILIAERRIKRTAIPEIVKLIVWERDQGRCIRCNSDQNLQFDHIIPVTKGGSNTEENIQILCQRCNLEKSDKIMF